MIPGWQVEMSAGLSEWFGVAELRTAIGQAEQAHRTTEGLLLEAARQPCVLVGRGGFAALADHPGARHVRLSAPRAWRIDRVAVDDPANFHLVVSAHRFPPDEIVDIVAAVAPALAQTPQQAASAG
jgi:hypothetical protein